MAKLMEMLSSLKDKKDKIARDWFETLTGIYNENYAGFLKENAGQFSNPVGFTISRELPFILDNILDNAQKDKLPAPLESIMRIMAVQDIAPSVAVMFIFSLKDIILKHTGYKSHSPEEILSLFRRIDETALLAFDIYMNMREKLYEIKANETRSRFGKMIDRLNAKYGISKEM